MFDTDLKVYTGLSRLELPADCLLLKPASFQEPGGSGGEVLARGPCRLGFGAEPSLLFRDRELSDAVCLAEPE